jgi:hypothetical protein
LRLPFENWTLTENGISVRQCKFGSEGLDISGEGYLAAVEDLI